MNNNQQKAKALLSLLGDRAKDILSLMSPEATQMLTSGLGSRPQLKPLEIAKLVKEVEDEVNLIKFGAPKKGAVKVDKEDDPFLSLDDDLSSKKNVESELEEVLPVRDPLLRSSEKIAELLQKEKVQIASFLISRMDESLQEEVMDALSTDYREQVEKTSVDSIPLSDAVFNRIFDKICKKTVEESLEKTEDMSFN